MMEKSEGRNRQRLAYIIIIIIIITGLVLISDVLTPLGYAVWLFYLIPLLLSARVAMRGVAYIVAAVVSGLVILGIFISPSSAFPLRVILFNRFSVIISYWIVAVFIERYNTAQELVKVQEVLRASEERFRALVTASSDVVYRMSPDWSAMYQLSSQSFLADTMKPNRNWLKEYIPEAEQERVLAAIHRSIREKGVFQLEHRVFQADGSIGWTFSRAVPISNEQGEITEWFGTASDITERKKAEEALRSSENKYHELFSKMLDGFAYCEIVVDEHHRPVDFIYREVNDQFEKQTELNKENVINKKITEILPNIRKEPFDWIGEYGKVALEGKTLAFEQYEKELNRWLLVTAYSPQKGFFAAIFKDITQRKEAEEALHDSEQRYSKLFNAKIYGVAHCRIVTDEQGKPVNYVIMKVNDTYLRIIGLKREDIDGKLATDVFPGIENMPTGYIQKYGKIALEGGELIYEDYFPATNQWLEIYAYQPKYGEFAAIFTDITERKKAEEGRERLLQMVEVQRADLQKILGVMPVGVWIADASGKMVMVNDAAATIYGGKAPKPERLEEYSVYKAFRPGTDERIPVENYPLPRALRGDTVRDMVIDNLRFDGTRGTHIASSTPLKDSKGNITGGVVVALDITERVKAEEALRESEERFRTMADALPQLAWIAKADGYIYWYNSRWYEYTGTTPEQMKGWGWESVHDPNVLPKVLEQWKASIATGKSFDMEFPLRGADGIFRPFLTRIMPLKNSEGNVIQWIGTNTDVSALRRAEEQLRVRNAQFEAFFENAPGILNLEDENFCYINTDKITPTYFGLTRETIKGKCVKDLAPPFIEQFGGMMRNVIDTGEPNLNAEVQSPVPGRKGEVTYWRASYFRVPLGDSKWGVGILGVEITDIKKTEMALSKEREIAEKRALEAEEGKRLLDVIMEYISEGLTIAAAPDARILAVSKVGQMLTGQPREVIEGIPAEEHPEKWNIYHMDGITEAKPEELPLTRAIRHGETVYNEEWLIKRPDGKTITIIASAIPVKDQAGKVTMGIVTWRDISERKRMEQELLVAKDTAEKRAAEAEEGRRILDALMEYIPEGIMVTDEEGNLRAISKYLAEISGRKRQEIIGKSFLSIDTALLSEMPLPERRRTARSGNQKTGAATAVAEAPSLLEYPIGRALKKGEITFSEERQVYSHDGIRRTVVLNAVPIRDARGRIVGAESTWRDITDRKKAEEAMLAANRELEQFAYVASHDLQEPLRMVSSFASLLAEVYQEKFDERGRRYLDYITGGASRMQALIQDLLTFSRVGRLDTERQRLDLNKVVDTVLLDLSEKIKETHAEVTHDHLPVVDANASSMGRLFMNLISNAVKFRKKDVPPKVHVSVQRAGREWQFAVSDNGIGIDPKYFDKIFVIFQRLNKKDEYPGTGMGLAISKKIVESYGGRIWVESEPGKGTTFFFTLPQ